LVFFRSVFTIILHLMSSLLLALGFWYLVGSSDKNITEIITRKDIVYFFMFCVLGITSHVAFDSALSFGYIVLLMFYIFFMYILMSYIIVQNPEQSLENTPSL
ncbi:hypothetical protein N9J72_03310, partial [Candidatus Gracilibacteria bacterium]|nr:hypothetical protein [Candidatus Gracilibacteria bacterium]